MRLCSRERLGHFSCGCSCSCCCMQGGGTGAKGQGCRYLSASCRLNYMLLKLKPAANFPRYMCLPVKVLDHILHTSLCLFMGFSEKVRACVGHSSEETSSTVCAFCLHSILSRNISFHGELFGTARFLAVCANVSGRVSGYVS